ncbi:MAG: preprotein translocase subunit YajC [Clostridia bacterium]|nr:preprotein translocase subunit YajC [Clostridia bacterium]
MQGSLGSILMLVLLFVAMYFLMIRPQKKKEKKIQEMRNSLSVGDEIVTIGGIIGKVVKTKDETFVIQVGADRVKIEMARWAVSEITATKARKEDELAEDPDDEKKAMPKRLKKSDDSEE